MEIFVALVKAFADGILMVLQIAMLVRAVLSWFPGGDGNIIGDIAYSITEPVIIPVRRFLERFESVKNFPIDMSFFVTFMIISMISAVLFP